ncbi:MAG: hypothetical protein JST76_07750 [Bacteroidetes bacterium]|nr:hypothetical protein [Bacteroidota bacterium]
MTKYKLLLTAILVIGAVSFAISQPTSSASSTGSLGGGGAPIDGGITLLVGGIAAYGAKKIRDNHKKMKAQKDI